MAIYLSQKDLRQIDGYYTHQSYVAGKTAGQFDFIDTNVIRMFSPITVPLNDYQMSGSNRYGTPQDMQNEVQEFILTQDKSFPIVIDSMVEKSSAGTMNPAARLKQEVDEQVLPTQDKYALAQYIKNAGKVVAAAAPTKSNILEMLSDAGAVMDNALTPSESRYCFIGASLFSKLRLADQVVHLEGTGVKAVERGVIGEVMGFNVVKVPDIYLPTSTYFLCYHKNAVENPHKIASTKIHKDPPGISGYLMEGRFVYDAFVKNHKSGGVYAAIASGTQQATPTIAISGTTATITSTGANAIKATVDGTDPRYSASAVTIQSGGTVEVKSGQTVKAVAYGAFTSDVAEKAN